MGFERAWRSGDQDAVESYFADARRRSRRLRRSPPGPPGRIRRASGSSSPTRLSNSVSVDLTRKQMSGDRVRWRVRRAGRGERWFPESERRRPRFDDGQDRDASPSARCNSELRYAVAPRCVTVARQGVPVGAAGQDVRVLFATLAATSADVAATRSRLVKRALIAAAIRRGRPPARVRTDRSTPPRSRWS